MCCILGNTEMRRFFYWLILNCYKTITMLNRRYNINEAETAVHCVDLPLVVFFLTRTDVIRGFQISIFTQMAPTKIGV